MRTRFFVPFLFSLAVFLALFCLAGCTTGGGADDAAVFTISTLTLAPAQVAPEQPITIGANVLNSGKKGGDYSATLKINDAVIETKQITLAAGETQLLSFQYSPPSAGSFRVDINGQTGSFIVVRPAAFALQALTVQPSVPQSGDNLTAGFQIRNDGDVQGDYQISLKVDGQEVNSTKVTLGGGATQAVKLDFSIAAAGTHSVEVGDLKQEIKVLKPADIKGLGLYITPSSALPGETFNIMAEFKNEGEVKVTRDMVLLINGSEFSRQPLTLEPGASGQVSFSYTTDKSGLSTVKILDLSGSLNVISLSQYSNQSFFYKISYPPEFTVDEHEGDFVHIAKNDVGELSVFCDRVSSTANPQAFFDRAVKRFQKYHTDWQVVSQSEIRQDGKVTGYQFESTCTINLTKHSGQGLVTVSGGLAYCVDFAVDDTVLTKYKTIAGQSIQSLQPAVTFNGSYSSAATGLTFQLPPEWIAIETKLSYLPVVLSASADENRVEGYIQSTTVLPGVTAQDFFNQALAKAFAQGWIKGAGSDFTFADGTVGYYCPVSGTVQTQQTFIYRIYSLVKDGRGCLLYLFGTDQVIKPQTETVTAMARSLAVTKPGGISGIDRNDSVILPEGEIPTLDPAMVETGPGELVGAIFSGLVRYDTSLKIVPDLAESWKVSGDGRTYTFTIRKNAKFHDGQAVTASTVKDSWERACDPVLTKSTKAGTFLSDITGVDERLAGQVSTISGVKVLDESTLEVNIKAAKPYFLAELAQPVAFVVDLKNVKSGNDWWQHPNGTGPFKVKSWEKDQQIVLERFVDFYLGPAKVKNLVFKLNATNALELYVNGEIDVTPLGQITKDQLQDPKFTFSKEVISGTTYNIDYIGLNVTSEPFKDSKVRQAVAMATDVSKLLELAYKGEAQKAAGYIPPGIPGYNKDLQSITFDLQRAKQLITESSYGSVDKIPEITYTSLYAVTPVDQAIIGMWQNLGLKVKSEVISNYDEFLAQAHKHQLQAWTLGWRADYLDPQDFLEVLFRSESQENYFGYSNPDVDAALAKAAVEQDPDKRVKMYQDIERMVISNLPAVPLWCQSNAYYLVKPYLKGYVIYPMSINIWSELTVVSH
jgi:oligopeptide transport system substrate-binding protein